MNVGELLEHLKAMNPTMPVVVTGYETGADDIAKVRLVKIALTDEPAWHNGIYDFVDPEEEGEYANPFEAVYLDSLPRTEREGSR